MKNLDFIKTLPRYNMNTLYLKLFAIQSKWVQVTKDWVNPHFRSKYMTLDNIIETLSSLLADNKLLVTHFIKEQELITRVVDVESGELLDSSFGLLATDPQKKGSEITYAKRYNLSALFNICADEDDDGNSASNNAPSSHETTHQAPTPTEWMNKAEFEQLFKEMHEGIITAWNSAELIKKARTKWKVSKAMEWEIATRYQKEFI